MIRSRYLACAVVATALVVFASAPLGAADGRFPQPSPAVGGAPQPGPAYTQYPPPRQQPYYFVPQNVEVYPYFGATPTFRWGYFGATRHTECVGPHNGYYGDYRQFTKRWGD